MLPDQHHFVDCFGVPVPARQLKKDQPDYAERTCLSEFDIRATDRKRSLFTELTAFGTKSEVDHGRAALIMMRCKEERVTNNLLY